MPPDVLPRDVCTSREPSKLEQENNANAITKASNEATATCPRLHSFKRRQVHS